MSGPPAAAARTMPCRRAAAGLRGDREGGLLQAGQQIRALDVEVHVGRGLRQGNQRMLGVVDRPQQAVLLGVPEGQHDGAARPRAGPCQRPADPEHRGDSRRVVGGAVADHVARCLATAGVRLVAEVVVMGADHHVLIGQVGAADHRDQVGAVGERLPVGRIAARGSIQALGDRPELIDQEAAGEPRPGRPVVAAPEPVARQPRDDDLAAGSEAGPISLPAALAAALALRPGALRPAGSREPMTSTRPLAGSAVAIGAAARRGGDRGGCGEQREEPRCGQAPSADAATLPLAHQILSLRPGTKTRTAASGPA